MEYTNLIQELRNKRIEIKAIAKVLDIDEKTMANKLYGRSKVGFSYDEAYKLRKMFLPEYDADYLFSRAEGNKSA